MILDEGLVEEVFSFLSPESQRHFVSALRFFNQRKVASYVHAAESIRRSLEEFLRFKLKNHKGLAGNIDDLQKIIKNNRISAQVRNIVNKAFSCLDKYFNENSKHNDGNINEAEIEFVLYQAGLLMRFINMIIL